VEGDWRLDEPVELLDEFDDELDELDELVPDELAPDELAEPSDVLSCDDVPESFAAVCAVPGRTAISAPVTATLAKDTVMVVAFRRRLPCSRSATARAISRLFMSPSLTRAAEWTVRGKSENAMNAGGAAQFRTSRCRPSRSGA
jgi:hypothetical protein